jgi:hypothetical protein
MFSCHRSGARNDKAQALTQPAHIRKFRQEEARRAFEKTLQVVEQFHAENGL